MAEMDYDQFPVETAQCVTDFKAAIEALGDNKSSVEELRKKFIIIGIFSGKAVYRTVALIQDAPSIIEGLPMDVDVLIDSYKEKFPYTKESEIRAFWMAPEYLDREEVVVFRGFGPRENEDFIPPGILNQDNFEDVKVDKYLVASNSKEWQEELDALIPEIKAAMEEEARLKEEEAKNSN